MKMEGCLAWIIIAAVVIQTVAKITLWVLQHLRK